MNLQYLKRFNSGLQLPYLTRRRSLLEGSPLKNRSYTYDSLEPLDPVMKTYFRFSSILGRRETNEDTETYFQHGNMHVVGLFDGHNGDRVAYYCKKTLQYTFQHCYDPCTPMKDVLQAVVDMIDRNVRESLLATETGATAVILVVDYNAGLIHVANVGDSRCIVGYKTGIEQTHDHKPGDPAELQRLRNSGARVEQLDGVWRVNGALAVSRSIGDGSFKGCGVSCEADYYRFQLEGAVYALLCCDGLCDVLTGEEIDGCVRCALGGPCTSDLHYRLRSYMDGELSPNTLLKRENGQVVYRTIFENVNTAASLERYISQAMTKLAYFCGSADNISVGICVLSCQ